MENKNNVSKARDLFDTAWKTYNKNIGVIAKFMILPFILACITLTYSKPMQSFQPFMPTPTQFLMWLVLAIVYLVVYGLANIALMYLVINISKSSTIGLKEAYTLSLGKLLSYWWVAFLVGIICVGGTILLIVPGIIFAIWYCFSTWVLVEEDLRGMNALAKSKQYVKGRWGMVFAKLAFIGVVVFIASVLINVIFKIINLDGLNIVGQAVTSFVLTPVALIYFYLLFKELKNTTAVEGVEQSSSTI